MKNIYLAQVNYKFGQNVFLPYSVGRLWSYAKSVGADEGYQLGEFKDSRDYKGFIFLREDPEYLAQQLVDPWAVFISHYIWNAEWNRKFASCITDKYPKCRIIVGGPEVPKREQDSYEYEAGGNDDCCYYDHMVHGEGEEWFADFLKRRGVTLYSHHVSDRVKDLTKLTSPYLDGTFDELME